jgi:hypothetical protein
VFVAKPLACAGIAELAAVNISSAANSSLVLRLCMVTPIRPAKAFRGERDSSMRSSIGQLRLKSLGFILVPVSLNAGSKIKRSDPIFFATIQLNRHTLGTEIG